MYQNASSRCSITEDGIYLTPQDKLDEALKRKKNVSSHVEQNVERGYKVYSSSESITSNDSNVSEIKEVYVLPYTTTTRSQPKGSSRQKRKTDVEDLYDEDHYSIANTKNCVTKGAGVLKEMSKNEHRITGPKEKKRFVTKKSLIVVGVVIVLFFLGGISGILLTMFAGTDGPAQFKATTTAQDHSTTISTERNTTKGTAPEATANGRCSPDATWCETVPQSCEDPHLIVNCQIHCGNCTDPNIATAIEDPTTNKAVIQTLLTTPRHSTTDTSASTKDSYISKPNTYCKESSQIKEYSTLSMAKQKCSDNDQCNSITNYQCNGGFWTCKDTATRISSSGSCSWLKKPIDSCCERIGISSTNYNRHSYLGTYKKESKLTDGRSRFVRTGGNGIRYTGNATLYWYERLNIWFIGPNPGTSLSAIRHQSCTGKGGFCPGACNSNWEVHNSSAQAFKIDPTLKMECLDCCDVIEVSSTVAVLTGSYAKQSSAESGRDYYLQSSANDEKLYLYWTSKASVWAIGSSLGSLSSLKAINDNCTGGTGFCSSGCGNTWKVWQNGEWVTDTTLSVTCRG